MRARLLMALAVCLAVNSVACAAGLRCLLFGGHIILPGPTPHPLPDEPCACRLHFCCHPPDHLIEKLLMDPSLCQRKVAAQHLGCRLFADYCQSPEILPALIQAMQCDPSWEVRYAAAWSIHRQKARNAESVVALRVASRLDPHYQVRVHAGEALDILLVLHRANYKEVLEAADQIVNQLRGKYKPGSAECRQMFRFETPAQDAEVREASVNPVRLLPARLRPPGQ